MKQIIVTVINVGHLRFDLSGIYRLPGDHTYSGKTVDWNPESFDELEARSLQLVDRHGLLELVEGRVELGDGLTILHPHSLIV